MEAGGHLRSAASERARGPLREFGKLVFFFVVKRAVYKRLVGRGQDGCGARGDLGTGKAV